MVPDGGTTHSRRATPCCTHLCTAHASTWLQQCPGPLSLSPLDAKLFCGRLVGGVPPSRVTSGHPAPAPCDGPRIGVRATLCGCLCTDCPWKHMIQPGDVPISREPGCIRCFDGLSTIKEQRSGLRGTIRPERTFGQFMPVPCPLQWPPLQWRSVLTLSLESALFRSF